MAVLGAVNSGQTSRNLTRDVVIYLIVSVTGGIILLILLKRYLHLKRTNQPLSHLFPWPWRKSKTAAPLSTQGQLRPYPRMQFRSTELSPYPLPYASPLPNVRDVGYDCSLDNDIRYPITAATLHPFYCALYPDLLSARYHYTNERQHRTRTRAVNIDEQGRRLDSGWDPDQLGSNSSDMGGCAEDIIKEVLPAYNRFGGPPNYAEVEREMDITSGDTVEHDIADSLDEGGGRT